MSKRLCVGINDYSVDGGIILSDDQLQALIKDWKHNACIRTVVNGVDLTNVYGLLYGMIMRQNQTSLSDEKRIRRLENVVGELVVKVDKLLS